MPLLMNQMIENIGLLLNLEESIRPQ